jgi:serine/threonine-protein kinase
VSQHVGNYRVIRKLGEGGMGVVFLAEHAVMGRLAAVKLLLPAMTESSEAVTRFFNEARATARIKHPGIVDIFDCAQMPNGQAYIVMEYLQGETLGSYVTRYGKLSGHVEVARAILRQIANALEAAHARGIVHRDLKPDNVFLSSEGGATDLASVKVLDFGIAKLAKGDKPFAVTTTRELLGTPVYISPEQCKGAKNLDHRSDIYSLGCIAFEMLTGQPVFIADSLGELIASHMFKEPPALTDLEPAVPPALADLVRRMLAKSPDDRPRSMAAVVDALDAAGAPAALRGAQIALPLGLPLEVSRAEDPSVTGAPTQTVGQYVSHAKRGPDAALPPPAPDVPAPQPSSRRAIAAIAVGAAAAVALVVWLAAGRAPSREAPPPVVAPAPVAPAAPPPPASAAPPAPVEVPPPTPPVEAPAPPQARPARAAPKTAKPTAKAKPAAAPKPAGRAKKTDLFLDL